MTTTIPTLLASQRNFCNYSGHYRQLILQPRPCAIRLPSIHKSEGVYGWKKIFHDAGVKNALKRGGDRCLWHRYVKTHFQAHKVYRCYSDFFLNKLILQFF